jgi:murein DD-endopeptidase MepM/ murein hydrolase activator NlpD
MMGISCSVVEDNPLSTLPPEPPIDPLEDTSPSRVLRAVKPDTAVAAQARTWQPTRKQGPPWGSILSFLAAAALTVSAVLLFVLPNTPTPAPSDTNLTAPATQNSTDSGDTNSVLTTTPIIIAQGVIPDSAVLPTVGPDSAAQLLATPVQNAPVGVIDQRLNPFTIIPERPRTEIETYTIVRGDTINGIAERFGLKPDSIAWSNDRRIVWTLLPNTEIFIPPSDGYIHTAVGNVTIAEIAGRYGGVDPYTIIDNEANRLQGLTPESVPPTNSKVFVPNGVGEAIVWTPPVEEQSGVTINGVTGDFVTFAPGDPGSCGPVRKGGGSAWQRPLGNYTFMRGFSSFHTGIDLAAPIGTPVTAANSGTVVFAGWNNWGYGNTVVLSHGPYLTLYGHMDSESVSCGQTVSAGQTIGAVGSTGNSSGPHLHFEIRSGNIPTDPVSTMAF